MYDVPGRMGNLPKDSINGTLSGISEIPTMSPADFSWCKNQPSAEDFGCTNTTLDKEDLIPPRRIQYDIAVENQLNKVRMGLKRRGVPIWLVVAVVLLLLFSLRSRT